MTNVEQNTEQPPALEAPPSPLSEETADGVSAVAATGVQAAPVPIVPDDGKPALEFAWNTHRYLNEYIRFADAKAGVVIAVCSALVASLYAGKVYSFLMKTAPAGWGWYGLTGAAASGLLVLGILFAGLTVWPRLASRQRRGFIFWKNILAHQDADEFVSSFQQGQAGHAEQVARHVYDLAQVANGKYFWIAWSIRAAVFGGVLAVLSLLLKEALP